MDHTATIRTLVPQKQQHILQNPTIKNENANDVFTVVKASVAKAILDLNWKEPGDVEYLTKELTRSIQNRFPMIRLVEIPQAIAKGVRKEYGEYHGLSVVTFENFISSYLKSPERIEMGKEIARLNEPKEPTLDEKFNVAKFVTLEALQCVKGGRVITLPGVTVYDFLERLKLIVFSVPEKREFVEEAKRELKREKEYLKSVELDKVKRRSIERFLDALQAGGEKGLVVSRAKRIAVNEYLRQVVLEGVDLELEIEERRADFIRARI